MKAPYLRIICCIVVLQFFVLQTLKAQQLSREQKKEDSLLKVIDGLKDDKLIYQNYRSLAELYLGVDKEKEAAYISKALFIAESTRDRKFIVKSCLDMVNQWNNMGSITERYDNALTLANKGIEIAKESQLNDFAAMLLVKKALTLRSKGSYAEAVKCNEEAVNYADLTNSDSIRILAEMSYANTLYAKDENLAAFKKYMLALNMAEAGNEDQLKLLLYGRIAAFYATVKQNEKAKDYYSKTIEYAKKLKDENAEINAYQDLILFYGSLKDFSSANEYLKILRKKCENSSNDFHKTRPLVVEVNLLFSEDMGKVAAYLRKNPKIVNDLKQWGYTGEAYKANAIMYSLEGKKDSAEYSFTQAKQALTASNNAFSMVGWNQAYVMHLERQGKFAEASKYAEENLAIAKKLQSMSLEKEALQTLDSLYYKGGNTQKLVANKLMLFRVTDSLDKQQKAKDLLNIEIDLENKRSERVELAKAEALRKKHNLQYMGITAAIIALFIALAAMGRLRVRPMLIRGLGFLSFILLFEFIILLIDKPIHAITHGEPLPVLLIKIVIIAVLLPLHHWLEHKVIHYLMQHRESKKNIATADPIPGT